MNALHPVMAEALRGIAPPPITPSRIVQDELLRRAVIAERRASELQDQLDRLLRTPFTIEVQTRAAVTNREPDFCSEAEYGEVEAPQHLVARAVDWLIDKHMRELEAKVAELMAKEGRA